ncbi:hypothetical protein SSE37_05922 [Sagittula stellata E-37]|uniref:Uncharacterized protein n=1 Tax=Sagittula stellata (strain ATCC 700073 / DSM 11524 / E-37) TaxID=388399 RepID=A3K9M5_SAGS3|nr:hypothetical protein SSE37_05922 [Sagittula stellata E-37]
MERISVTQRLLQLLAQFRRRAGLIVVHADTSLFWTASVK